jgi:DNA modification methylase
VSARSIHPFPARMAPEIAIDHLESNTPDSEATVLDPMCGSGTVLAAAVARGHRAIGFDMDPLAVLMSSVAVAPTGDFDLEEQAHVAVRRAKQSRSPDLLPWHDEETRQFIEYWFAPVQRTQLTALSRELHSLEDRTLRSALQLALSRTIVTKSPRASLAADTSHSRPHRILTESDYDVFGGFEASVAQIARLMARRTLSGSATVERGDSRLLTSVAPASVDLTITSPPYLNAIDYLRGHRLSLVWMGYSIPDLREIRRQSVGAERAPDAGSMTEKAEELVERVKAHASDVEKLPVSILRRYAQDLLAIGAQLRRVSKPGGRVVTVIGNSTLRGNYIDNGDLVDQAMTEAGFSLQSSVERPLPPSKRYLPISANQSALEKRMRSELVLVHELA